MAEEIVVIECQKCGHEIGQMRLVKGKDMLVVNGFAVTFLRGVCLSCGREFHWDVGTKSLAKLIESEHQ